MTLSLIQFVEKHNSKDQTTSFIKMKEVLRSLRISTNIYMRDIKFTTKEGNVKPSSN